MKLAKQFADAFEHNFYETKEFIHFCADVTGKINSRKNIHGRNISVIGNKNPSISVYSEDEQRLMMRHNISFLSVGTQNNSQLKNPTFMEYPILFRAPYETQMNKTDKTFKKYVRKTKQLPYTFSVEHALSDNLFEEVYRLYQKQMKRLKSFSFPKLFFKRFLQVPQSLVLLLYYQNKIAGYGFCFEYYNNLYTSIGGIGHDFFDRLASYAMYHEKISYAAKHNLNIHMGVGTHGSGYNTFKVRTGAVAFSCTQVPDTTELTLKFNKLNKVLPLDFLMQQFGNIFPEKLLYTIMPFT